MSENKPFASRYIETGAGTALAFAAVVRATVGAIMLIPQLLTPSSGSWIFDILERSLLVSSVISVVLEVMAAIGLMLMRYKLKGCEVVYWSLLLNFISTVITSVLTSMAGSTTKELNIVSLISLFVALANAFYYYSGIGMIKFVRTELKNTERCTDKNTNSVPAFCIIILVVTLANALFAYITFGDATNIPASVLDIFVYCSLYKVAKDFDKEHNDIMVPLGN